MLLKIGYANLQRTRIHFATDLKPPEVTIDISKINISDGLDISIRQSVTVAEGDRLTKPSCISITPTRGGQDFLMIPIPSLKLNWFSFLSHSGSSVATPNENSEKLIANQGDREPVLILIIGSRRGITNIMQTLFRLNFAQVHEWSKPQVDPNSGRLMSILTKYIRFD
jgi:hypothetical protein